MKEYPDIDTPVLIEAAQFVKDKDTAKAIEVLKVFCFLKLMRNDMLYDVSYTTFLYGQIVPCIHAYYTTSLSYN